MQMELCEGGTLQSWVDSHVEATEVQLLTVLRHTALVCLIFIFSLSCQIINARAGVKLHSLSGTCTFRC